MNKFGFFEEIALNCLHPQGWLRNWLICQRDGLTGHLEAAGYPFGEVGWDTAFAKMSYQTDVADEWWPYEQTGYWVDGMVRCGLLLDDPFLLNKARQSIDNVLKNPDKDGYLGPAHIKRSDGSAVNRWAHAVFFRSLMAYSCKEQAVIPAMLKHYLSGTSDHNTGREVCNTEIMAWLYAQTGNEQILELAENAYESYNQKSSDEDTAVHNMLSDKRASEHGVTYMEQAKLGAVLYLQNGNETWLQASIHAFEKLKRDQLLADGVCSSSEFLRGKDPLDSHETCDIADMTWSLGYLLMATGDPGYADWIEKACFNAAPGAVTSDFRALQYFSCPNQVICDRNSNHNLFYRGEKWMSYRPNPGTECCPGNVNRIMPNYVGRMWLKRKDGYAAVLYGSCEVELTDQNNKKVKVEEITDYPFEDVIRFRICCDSVAELTLYFRIPVWCECAELHRSDCVISGNSGTFVRVEGSFADGEEITLRLPMHITVQKWGRDGISVERGPLVYSLPIKAEISLDKTEKRATEDFPAYNMRPLTDFNYALVREGLEQAEFIRYKENIPGFNSDSPPVGLKVKAIRLPGYDLKICDEIEREIPVSTGERKVVKVKGNFVFTPQLPDKSVVTAAVNGEQEEILLVPYGAAKLRVTVFPYIGA